jgi:branched-chain amino acid transport system substrate-binding protein
MATPAFGPGGQPTRGVFRNDGPKVKVALLLPLTAKGNTAQVAKALKQAGELALFDFDNPAVTLIAKDTKGTIEGARLAAEAAVQEGAELIVGPLFAKSVGAAAPVAKQAGVPIIAFSSDRQVAGNGVYLLSFVAGHDVNRIVSYAISQGKRSFAGLIPKTAYGDVVENAFTRSVSENGGQIVSVQRYPADANGMLEPARKIAEMIKGPKTAAAGAEQPQAVSTEGSAGGAYQSQVDTIFIPAGPETLPTIAALMPYFEIDTKAVKLLGTGRWAYAGVGREKPLTGAWFPGPDPKGWRAFTQRYVKTYGKTPPRLASLAYDAVSLAVSLSSNPAGSRYTQAQLTRGSGFAGVDGLFRLMPDGTSQRGLAILEVQRFGTRVIDPAPSSFGSAQF